MDNITSGDAQRDAPKCASDGPLEGPVESVYLAKILNYNLFYRGFLLWPAAQLQCGAGDALGPSGGANGAT